MLNFSYFILLIFLSSLCLSRFLPFLPLAYFISISFVSKQVINPKPTHIPNSAASQPKALKQWKQKTKNNRSQKKGNLPFQAFDPSTCLHGPPTSTIYHLHRHPTHIQSTATHYPVLTHWPPHHRCGPSPLSKTIVNPRCKICTDRNPSPKFIITHQIPSKINLIPGFPSRFCKKAQL